MAADISIVKADLASFIKSHRDNRINDRRNATFIALYIGLVSAVTTASIGLSKFFPNYSEIFDTASLLFSSSLTVVAAWDGLFRHKKLWLNSARTLNELYALETEIRHAEATTDMSMDDAENFKAELQKIVNDNNERWFSIRE